MAFQLSSQIDEEAMRQMQEDEYKKLKSKFRLTELEKVNYPNQVKAVLMKQEKVLDILDQQKKDITTNISVTTSKSYRGVEDKRLTKVYDCIEEEKKLDDEIMNQKSQIKDLKNEIQNVKKEIIEINKTEIHETRITESIMKSQKRVSNLENKLQVCTTKFNDILTQNASYRKEIESLLNERKNFFKFYMRLYKQLLRGKQIMLDLVEQTTTTYDQREEAFTKLKSLKEKTKAEKNIQSKDVKDLKRKLENAEELFDFLAIKGQRRILADLEAREAREKKRQREEMEEKIKRYIILLDKIKKLSDEEDINKFVSRFSKNEAENLTLFNYVNEVNDEVEYLQNEVTTYLHRIDEERTLHEKRAREQLEVINGLKEILDKKQEAYENASARLQSTEILLNDLLFNIEKMFQEFECDSKPVLALLGNNAHVNVYNVNLCLRLLEKQLYEFIYIAYAKERHTAPEELVQGIVVQEDYHMVASKRHFIYHLTPSSPCPLCVETDRIFVLDENNETDSLEEYADVHRQLLLKVYEVDMTNLLHNISTCRLPRSRAIMQARFQEQEHEKIEAAASRK